MAPRQYTLRQRALRQDRTRQRIVKAALELHESIGPAATTITAVAERAGVQRLTVYRHFPDEGQLGMACQQLFFEQHQPPNPAMHFAAAGLLERLRLALGQIYPYYRETAAMAGALIRDAPVSQIAAFGLASIRQWEAAVLASIAGDEPRIAAGSPARVAIAHVLEFETWQSLTSRQGLDDAGAAAFAVRIVESSLAAAV